MVDADIVHPTKAEEETVNLGATESYTATPMPTVTLADGQEWPVLWSSTLLVRSCYQPLYEDVLKEMKAHRALVTGTPGIAKSSFALYVLWRVVKEGQRAVVYQYDKHRKGLVFYPAGYHRDYPDGAALKFARTDPRLVPHDTTIAEDPDALVISDSIKPSGDRAKTLMVSSPQRDKYKEFLKNKVVEMYIMPLWSREELVRAWMTLPKKRKATSTDKLRFLMDTFGGSIRFVLGLDDDLAKGRLQEALTAAANDPRGALIAAGTDTTSMTVPHTLFHNTHAGQWDSKLLPNDAEFYQPGRTIVASPELEKLLAAMLPVEHMLQSMLALEPHRVAVGNVFEQAVKVALLQGGQFKVRVLRGSDCSGTVTVPDSTSKGKKRLLTQEVETLKDAEAFRTEHPQLLLPTKHNEAIADFGVAPDRALVNATIGESHTLNIPKLKELVDVLAPTVATAKFSLKWSDGESGGLWTIESCVLLHV